MSQYAYGHGAPHTGYQTSQPHLYSSDQPYGQPPFHPNGVVENQSIYSQGTTEAYGYNQTTIPGLGMGFTHSAATWQHAAAQSLPGTHADPSASVVHWQTSQIDGNARPGSSTSASQRPNSAGDNKTMEEGELSEGELEDIYEPTETEANRSDQPGVQPPGSIDQSDRSQLPMENLEADHDRTWNSKQSGRERSGSYSPYLSPREIQSSGLENGASNAHTPQSGFYDHNKSMVMNSNGNESPSQNETKDGPTIISESKKHAQDAILCLWPLNVRYQNYIEEGVDRDLLDQLFTELGLELDPAVPRAEQSRLPMLSQVNTPQSDLIGTVPSSGQTTPLAVTIAPKVTPSAKDKAEERKDRIARLLAAKGSKATVVDAVSNKTGTSTPVSNNVMSTTKFDKAKAQSEKSKLIQQRMEALIKAREANAKTPQSSTPPVSSVSQPVPDTSRSNSQAPVDLMNVNDHIDAAAETTDPSSGPPIPGLFLSSSVTSPVPNQRKRPVAADLNENSIPSIQKRPFGQTRESRPFLIDVSDDEDDAEMEIDSPELRPLSVQRPVTPGSRALSFRDGMSLPDSSSRSAGSMIDLASMNRKIEDMKRKIAEAEARKKKAKQSGSGSPLPQSETQSKEGSADVAAPPTPPVRGASTIAEVVRNSPTSIAPQPGISPGVVIKPPKVREQRLQARPSLRARVASERLPIVTAQRKECQEQLEYYQSEVARVKKEIENKLVEEERLQRDAKQTEPTLSPISTGQDELEPGLHDERSSADPSPQVPVTHDAPLLTEPDERNEPGDEVERDVPMDESPYIESAVSHGSSTPQQDESQMHEEPLIDHEIVEGHSPLPTRSPLIDDMVGAHVETPTDTEELEEDVAMDEADTSSEEESVVEDESDDYEPTNAGVSLPDSHSPFQRQPSPQRISDDSTVLETSDTDLQGLATVTPITKPISTGAGDTESESNREAETQKSSEVSNTARTTLVPYETPLQYFKAYRFHPQYSDSVAGGLRSLTYSNNIDVTREVCPDQLAHGVCPRGSECQFQHFEDMQLPDDQILVQLGASGNPETEHQDQYVAGLRELLKDFRNRKVKDFQEISQGLIEYRARFLRDKTKILPLSGVTL
ncbi:hypothetical protein FVEN_g2430 [Fusarium venenatum]|uniref:C3H1-type domain-containing protein n=1 Tax=Fusarium venenatum TaxID=56646 RepID=A0A2L2TD63_9HYPO|nr:uncharacterized protein FVRRES_05362 [Fusarium venenatum]KAG8359937.1 hypothetical protein FVEN_g2430 [Fusarium venenatum]CEI60926.1 unnamed protein product [Fusarium venenatum]